VRFAQAWAVARPAVSGYLLALIPDRHAADDLEQEIALAAFRGFPEFRPDQSFTGWALGIARHKVKDRWRSLARGRLFVADPALADELAQCAEDLEDDLAEERVALQDCLASLGKKAWVLVQGRYHDDLAAEDLAVRLGTTAGNVRVMLHRVRDALRTCIERRLAGAAASEVSHG
jgi:RNA polymerase sigma-70 factor (ECF subfamily)